MVVIPARGNVVYLIRLLPVSWVDFLGKVTGIASQMDDFKGRGSVTNRMPGLVSQDSK